MSDSFAPGAWSSLKFLQTNFFEIQIGGEAGGEPQGITFPVVSTNIPSWSADLIELKRGSAKASFFGSAYIENWEVQLLDTYGETTSITKFLKKWFMNNHNWQTGDVNIDKRGAVVIEYSPTGSIVNQFTLEGCLPVSISYGELNMDTADKKVVSLTISIDYIGEDLIK